MKFSECYKNEMDKVKRDRNLDRGILDAVEETGNAQKRMYGWKKVVTSMAVLLCVTVLMMNFNVVQTYAETLLGSFGLWVEGQEFELAVREPMDLTLQQFIQSGDVERVMGGRNHFLKKYQSYDNFKRDTDITLSDSEDIQFSNIIIDVSGEYFFGGLSIECICNGETVHMNGMFMMEGYAQEELGYGDPDGKLDYIYEYQDGKKAYFVKDQNPDHAQVVYFSEKNIVFQLFVSKEDRGRELGKKIVDAMAE